MKIALLGYGKMGTAIDDLIKKKYAKQYEVILRSDSANAHSFSTEALAAADVAIEFTKPQAAIANIEKCFEANVPVVVGTTGWYGKLKYITELAQQKNQALFYGSNFSIGMNLFFQVNQQLDQLMNDHKTYTPKIEETHHKEKRDAPSGTAITLAEDIVWRMRRLDDWTDDEDSDNPDKLSVIAHRSQEDVKGVHSITYTSPMDTIEIKHTAHTRDAFAFGAITAANWLKDKKGIFTMKDLLNA